MTMPIDLVLVRHGESEGNLANKMSRNGDNSAFTEEFRGRSSSLWRLTKRGRDQAIKAGVWIKNNIGQNFDRCYVSEYVRAKETAFYLGIQDAEWYVDFYLRERDYGQMDNMTEDERRERFNHEIMRRRRDGFFWTPLGGESMANLCLREYPILTTLHRECPDKKVIIVCHGEVMWGFRVRLERMSQSRYCELETSRDSVHKIHNCQILHYTRRDPESGKLANHLNWLRSICPWDISLSDNEWRLIERPKYSNQDLLNDVQKYPQLIKN